MSDHKDITNYSAIPTIVVPAKALGLRALTSAECEAKAQETLEAIQAGRYADARDLRYLKRELRLWQQYAAERA